MRAERRSPRLIFNSVSKSASAHLGRCRPRSPQRAGSRRGLSSPRSYARTAGAGTAGGRAPVPHAGPILHARAHSPGELAPRRPSAGPASQHGQPVLRHPQLRRHDFDDLLAAVAQDLSRVARRLAASALPRPMLDRAVGALTEPQRLATMPDLPSGVLTRRPPQTLRPLRPRRVSRGRAA